MIKVLFNDILFIVSLKDYLKIININKNYHYPADYFFISLEEMLPKTVSAVHRSYIIAINKIDAFYGATLEI